MNVNENPKTKKDTKTNLCNFKVSVAKVYLSEHLCTLSCKRVNSAVEKGKLQKNTLCDAMPKRLKGTRKNKPKAKPHNKGPIENINLIVRLIKIIKIN